MIGIRAARLRTVSGAWRWAWKSAAAGGTAGAVVNAANEAAVAGFLAGELGFTEIVPACRSILEHHDFDASPTLERLARARRLGSPGGITLGLCT